MGLLNYESNITQENPLLKRINALEGPLLDVLFQNAILLRDIVHKQSLFVYNISMATLGLWGFFIMITCFTNPLLMPSYDKVRDETQRYEKKDIFQNSHFSRTIRILLMIPMDIMETVPAMKDYLDGNSKWKIAFDSMVVRNKAALDQSLDAILFTSTSGKIQYSNSGTT